MKMYLLEPEVAGGIGDNTVINYKDGRINEVVYLHYEFEGWLGDELLTSSPCFIVTETLANEIIQSNLLGYKFEEIEISKSEVFEELYPDKILPKFVRLVPLGKLVIKNNIIIEWSGDDFCLENNIELTVSENALGVIKNYRLNNCVISELGDV